MALLTKKQLLDDTVQIQGRKRKRVVFEEHEDALIMQGDKDRLKWSAIYKLLGRSYADVWDRGKALRKLAVLRKKWLRIQRQEGHHGQSC